MRGVLVKKTGWSEEEIRNKVKVCVVTLGEKGCQIFEGEKLTEVTACIVEKLVNPTGAGDAFRAGFLHGYLRSWPLKQSAQLGAVTAAYAVEQMGTQEHTFTKSDVEKRYRSSYDTNISI